MKTRSSDVLVLGSGPAGLRAGLIAAKTHKVTFLDRDLWGKRILVSGNGRANFFNDLLLKEETYSSTPFCLVKDIVLDQSNLAKEFFSYLTEELGFAYRKEGHLYYPFFNRSECLLSFLRARLEGENTEFLQGEATKISGNSLLYRNKRGEEESLSFSHLVLALGGESYDRAGKDNSTLLSSLGRERSGFSSCLCPLLVKERIPAIRKNQRLKGRLTLLRKGKTIYSEEGEILFKKDGISGICAFNASLYLRYSLLKAGRKESRITFDFLSGKKRHPSCYPVFLSQGRKERKREKDGVFLFHPVGFYPLKDSQVSFGGVSLTEIDRKTRQWKKNPSVQVVGERLFPAFPCGGFNRGLSFIEGYKAGKVLNGNDGR